EAALLQPFGVERHAETIMPDNLDQIATRTSEDKEVACMGIAPQRFLDLQSQAIHAAPHVRSSDRKPDAHIRGNRDHSRRSTPTPQSHPLPPPPPGPPPAGSPDAHIRGTRDHRRRSSTSSTRHSAS